MTDGQSICFNKLRALKKNNLLFSLGDWWLDFLILVTAMEQPRTKGGPFAFTLIF